MIFPSKLQLGDNIATTAVSMGCVDSNDILRLENASKKLNKLGFRCIETKNARNVKKLVSSSATERARQFMDLMENENVKVIIATSGGEILMEILPYLDFEKMKKLTPKWIQGYSDPSLLNYVITTKTNIAN